MWLCGSLKLRASRVGLRHIYLFANLCCIFKNNTTFLFFYLSTLRRHARYTPSINLKPTWSFKFYHCNRTQVFWITFKTIQIRLQCYGLRSFDLELQHLVWMEQESRVCYFIHIFMIFGQIFFLKEKRECRLKVHHAACVFVCFHPLHFLNQMTGYTKFSSNFTHLEPRRCRMFNFLWLVIKWTCKLVKWQDQLMK
jgi:hypothetical protein